MTGIAVKYAVRRYQPTLYRSAQDNGAVPLTPNGQEQIFDDWPDVVRAADTIIGDNCLKMGVPPTDPVVKSTPIDKPCPTQ